MGAKHKTLRTHCKKGHEFTPENTMIEGKWRRCRTCKYAVVAKYRNQPHRRIKRCEEERLRRQDPVKRQEMLDRLKVKLYGLTPERRQEMIDKQGGCCAICKKVFTYDKGLPAIDHDHACCPSTKTCGKCIRGILCYHCNSGLGNFKDNIESLESAIKYLRGE